MAGQHAVTAPFDSALFQDIVESEVDGVVVTDQTETVRFLNSAAEHMFGYSVQEVLGHNAGMLLAAPLCDEPDTFLSRAAVKTEPQKTGELRDLDGRHKDGHCFPIQLAVTQIRGGEQSLFAGIVHDLSTQSRAEQKLLESEERNRAIIESALDAVISIDGKGIIIGWNAQAVRMFGYSCDEVLGKRLSNTIIPPQYRKAHERGLKRFLDTGEGPLLNLRFEITALHKSGYELPVELAIVPLHGCGRDSFSAFVRDISERKHAEERIRRSEEQLRLTLENAPIGIATTDLQGHLLSVNPTFCRLLGYTADELLKLSVLDITYPEDRDTTHQRFEALILGKIKSYELKKRYVRKDGRVITGHARAGLVKDVNGNPLIVVGEVQDVTEHERAVQEVQRMRSYLKNIVDSMPSVLVGVNTEGEVTEWNQSAEQATDVSVEDAVGRSFVELFPEYEPQMDDMREAIHRHVPIRIECLAIEDAGETRYTDVMIYPLLANGVTGAVIRMDDITDRVRIEQMMVEAEKMMSVGGLAAGMAHEINNPLSGVLQSCQNIQRRLSDKLSANRQTAAELGIELEQVRRYLQQRGISDFLEGIKDAAGRASRIVNDMLSFSRRSGTEMAAMQLNLLLDSVVRLASSDYDLKKRYDFKQIEIVRDYDSDLPACRCDVTEIEQVFLNLIKNAAQAMADYGKLPHRITLRTRRDGDYARIEVEDNGPGMDETTRKRVFEPFFTTKPAGVGTGLGLSVSYFIVTEQHKGSLSVISAPDKGARFVIRLPLGQKQESILP